MVFSTLSFLCIFLPFAAGVHFLLPQRFVGIRNAFLILMSLLFYSYGEPVYVLLMLLCTLWTFFLTRLMSGKLRQAALYAGVISDFLILGFFKYAAFFLENLLAAVPALAPVLKVPDISLPIGISFYTFQSVSYLIDVYRGDVEPSRKYGKVLLYISFFPQLIAGPILRYSDMDKAMDGRRADVSDLGTGVRRFIRGLSKKVLIANVCGAAVDRVFSLPDASLSSPLVLLTALAYTFQIYFDFSGYSDMAIGMGRMFGFRFPENFNYPYRAVSMQDFWRRWHISLSGWFRDYLYIPLGGNRRGTLKTIRNRMLVFFCTGLWHGANWTFVFWGLFHGFFVSVENLFVRTKENEPAKDPSGSKEKGIVRKIIGRLYVMIVVTAGFLVFRADSLRQAMDMFWIILSRNCGTIAQQQALYTFCSRKVLLVMLAALILSMQLYRIIPGLRRFGEKTVPVLGAAVSLLLLLLSMIALSGGGYNPFIYFRF